MDRLLSAALEYDKNETEEYLLRNHQTGKYAYIDPEKANVQYGDIPENEDYAKWKVENVDGYVRLKNIATDEYMHIENLSGYVEHGKVPSTYWSAQWSVKQVDNYLKFTNRWQIDKSIHTEDMKNVHLHSYAAVPQETESSLQGLLPYLRQSVLSQ